jgi:uncharacterized protein YqgC (DUF456 family)
MAEYYFTSMTIFLWIIAVLLVVIGIAGTILPMLPGVPLVFLGLLIAAGIGHFDKVGPATLVVLGVLMLSSYGVDLLSTALGAKRAGASKYAIIGAAAGTMIGLFFSIPGIILGPFIGAVAGEYLRRRNLRQAGKAGLGAWLGMVAGAVMKIAIAFAMIAIFILAYIT